MITYPYRVNGDAVSIHVIETKDDLDVFMDWVDSHKGEPLGIDTETTGVDIFTTTFKVRTFQIGNSQEAYVVPLDERTEEMTRWSRQAVTWALRTFQRGILHNSTFDALALAANGYIDDAQTFHEKVTDTYLMAHILDAREAGQGTSIGHGLKNLCNKWVDWKSADTQSGLTEVFRKEFKKTKTTGWTAEGLTFNKTYLTYAGLDVIYVSHLHDILSQMVERRGLTWLLEWELKIQRITMSMENRGVLLDVDYTRKLHQQLLDEAAMWADKAKEYGVENVNSTQQVSKALIASGVKLTKKTATGNPSVGSDVLLPLAGLDPSWVEIPDVTPHPLAEAVVKSKRAMKWDTAYIQQFLNKRDRNNRVHPGINSLAARTARMSISNPPLQQLPSKDWKIRRCFIADDDHVFISTDFSQVELRVIAANAGVVEMIDAIKTGVDLHDRTATLIWGENFTKKQRSMGKNVAFGKVFGAGPKKIAQTAGIPLGTATEVVNAFNQAYPEIDGWSKTLERRAENNHYLVTTAFGRELPVDPDKMYAALNYETQSTARDLFAHAMERVSEAGLGENLVLPIHDELVHQAPIVYAEEQAQKVASLMHGEFKGVPIDADSEIATMRSWGSLYGAPQDIDIQL